MRVATLVAMLALAAVSGCSPAEQPKPSSVTENTASTHAQRHGESGSRCELYEPALIELQGRLTAVVRYGPPDFGENPDSDEKLNVPLLTLGGARQFCADPAHPADTDAVEVTQVQLNFAEYGDVPANLLDSEVLVTGTVMRAISGYHFTPVVLSVVSIRAAPAQ